MFLSLFYLKTNATKCRLLWKKFFIDLCSNKRKGVNETEGAYRKKQNRRNTVFHALRICYVLFTEHQ